MRTLYSMAMVPNPYLLPVALLFRTTRAAWPIFETAAVRMQPADVVLDGMNSSV